jgi:hypothetical protein
MSDLLRERRVVPPDRKILDAYAEFDCECGIRGLSITEEGIATRCSCGRTYLLIAEVRVVEAWR